MNKVTLPLLLFFFVQLRVNAQVKIGDNPTRINNASLLELEKSDRGLVFPRVAITDANRADPLPLGVLNGTTIFNTNHDPLRGLEKGLYVWVDNKWVSMGGVFDWHLNGNAGTNSDSNFIGTTDNASLSFRTNNIQRMIIDSQGAVNFGTQVKIGDNPNNINPASILELETTNKGFVFPRVSLDDVASPSPLPPGLLRGTVVYNTNEDTRKGKGPGLYMWSGSEWTSVAFKEKDSNSWSVNGNAALSVDSNFLGTTDNVGLTIRTDSIQRMFIDSAGSVAIGRNAAFSPYPGTRELLLVDAGNTTSHTVANFRGNIDNYLQINLQNTSASPAASTDFVATADDGTDTSNYSDMGINSSTFTPSDTTWGGANDGYFYSHSKRLIIGTKRIGSDLVFLTGGGIINEDGAMLIEGSSRNIVIGKGDNTDSPRGNVIRGPSGGSGTNINGGNLTLRGGSGAGTGRGGNLNLLGGVSASGRVGDVNISGVINMRGTSLNIAGIQATSSLPNDSVLTVFNGALKKAPYTSAFPILKNLFKVTLPAIGNNEGANLDLTVPNTPFIEGGPNPVVAVNPEADLPEGVVIAWVRVFAENRVRIHFRNVTNTNIDSQDIEFDVSVFK